MARGKSPKFGKRHYIILAEAMRKARPDFRESSRDAQVSDAQWAQDVRTLCNALREDNPAFSDDYFESTVSGLTKGTNCRRET